MPWSPQVEMLAHDIKSLVPYGAKRQHVLARRTLREFVAVRYEETKPQVIAQAIVEELRMALARLPDVEAEALRYLLVIDKREAKHMTAPARRRKAIMILGLSVAVDTFKRADGEELDLMRKLAIALTFPEEVSQTG